VKLKVSNLVKRYHERPVLDISETTFGNHSIEGLIGPNGAGKSTLMGLLTRRIAASSGSIYFHKDENNVHNVMRLQSHEVARIGLIKTNQRIQNFESLSIRDSLRLAATSSEHESLSAFLKKKSVPNDSEDEIERYLEKFSFSNPEGFAKSAGEKKLLDILRCLIFKPKMLLMDEPTAGLPDDITRKVMDELLDQAETNNIRILIVEHDLDLIWTVCEYVHFLSDGELLFQGTPDDVKKNKFVAEKYLGVG